MVRSGTSPAGSTTWFPPLLSRSRCSAAALQPGTRSPQPRHAAQGTAREAGGSGSVAAGGLEAPGLPPRTPAKHLQQAGAGSRPALVEKQPSRKVRARAFGVGDPDPAGWSSLGGAPGPLGSPMQPPAWHGMAQHGGEGHWVTRPGRHASSAAEGESIGCVSLTPPTFPTSTKADLALGPRETGVG